MSNQNGSSSHVSAAESDIKVIKSVSFYPEALVHQAPRESVRSYRSEPFWESLESTSGYLAEDGIDKSSGGLEHRFCRRLLRFYAKYNPRKQNKVVEYLKAYVGAEEQLFAILVAKYGPEPAEEENANVRTMDSELYSEDEHVTHIAGKRCKFPTLVKPEEGKTDCETPYWAGITSLISERDLLSLLQNLVTKNIELQKCFMGIFADHPTDSWNGMTYISQSDDIAPQGAFFLGHLWVGTLGSGKVLFHKKVQYHRTTLYCTEECQQNGNHERWRLSVYRSELSPLVLLRTLWDPAVVPEPLPLSRSNMSARDLYSSSELFPSQPGRHTASDVGQRVVQPTAPAISGAVSYFSQLLSELESRIMDRLNALNARVESIERQFDTNQ